MDWAPVGRMCPKSHRNSYLRAGTKKDRQTVRSVLKHEGRLARGALPRLSLQSGIPVKTLKGWRTSYLSPLTRDTFDPFQRRQHPPRALSKDVEDQIHTLLAQRIQTRRYTPRSFLRKIALDLGKPHNPKFKAGRKWVRNFLRRYHLSLRIPHAKRRTTPDDDQVSSFLEEFEIAKMQLPRRLILNMDETSWRLSNGTLHTIARRGVDDVSIDLSIDAKTSITVICAVAASGHKLSPWAIIKGKTTKCELRYRNSPKLARHIRNNRLIIDHTESGWATAELMKRYVKWLSDQLGRRFSYLLWDLHSSHRDEGVREKAHKRNVNLSFIPAGQTGQWQPLDRRVFGVVKREAEQKLDEICIDEDLAELNMMDALGILVDVWYKLDEKVIKASWDHLFIADDVTQEEAEAPENQDVDEDYEYDEGEEEEEEEAGSSDEDFVEEYRENPVPDDEEEDEEKRFASTTMRELTRIR